MAQTEIARAFVDLDGKQAGDMLKLLKRQAKEYREELTKAIKAGDFKAVKKIEKDIKANAKATNTLKKATYEVNIEMNKLNGMSFKQLKKAQKDILNQIKSMKRGTKEEIKLYNEKLAIYKKVSNEVEKQQKGFKTYSKNVRSFGQNLKNTLKGLIPILGIGALITGAVKLGKELFNLSKTMESENRRAAIVFGDSLGYVEGEAKKLSKAMGVTNHEFVAAAASTADLLIPLDFTRDKAADMSVQLQSLAGALDEWTGGTIGAAEVSNILTKAMLGENEQLKRLGIAIRKDSEEFRDLVKLKLEDTNVTKAQAEAMATLELIYKKSADAQTAFNTEGNKLLRWQKGVSRWWRQLKEDVVGYFDVKTSDKLIKERIEVNKLVIQLTDANTKAGERHEILLKLKKINPKIVEGLDAENIEVEKLTGNLKNYNKELIDRIALEKVNIKLQENKERLLKIAEKIERAEGDAAQTLLKFNEEIALDTKKTFEEKMQLTKKYLEDNFLLETIYTDQKTGIIHKQYTAEGYAASQLGSTLLYLNSLREEEIELGDIENEILKERTKLMQILASSVVAPEEPPPTPTISLTTKQIADYYDAVKLEVIKGEKEVRELTEDELKKLAKAREKAAEELKKQLEAEEKYRQDTINAAKSLIEQEEILYQERLKKAGLFGKKKEDMTKQELEALEVLEKNHIKNIDDIEDKAISDDIKKQQELFDQITIQRKTDFNNQLAELGDNEEAKKQLKEEFEQKELERHQLFLKKLTDQLKSSIESGEWDGINIEDAMLSDEQKESLIAKLAAVELALAEIRAKASGGSGEDETEQEAFDIFGMSSEDWIMFLENLADGKLKVDQIQFAVNALMDVWQSFHDIRTNNEQKELQQFESNSREKEKLLAKQLKDGIIDQEKYNDEIALLDDSLEKKQIEIANKRAKREKEMALIGAITNTALAVVKALGTQPVWVGIALAAIIAALGGIQIAKIASTPVPQYALGNYLDVIGLTDKKKYRAKKEEGTGLYDQPTLIPGLGLVAEKQPEIVFSGPDTQKILNAPGLIDAINYTLRAPQFAAGQTQTIEKHTTETITQPLLSDDMVDAMNRFSDTMEILQNEGIKGKWVWSEFEEMRDNNEEIEESVNMRD